MGIVRRTAHVALLDYEIELGLVFRKTISSPVAVTADNLHEYVFGIVIANDFSARDVQLPQSQFFKGKSYRGFCPLGTSSCSRRPISPISTDSISPCPLVAPAHLTTNAI